MAKSSRYLTGWALLCGLSACNAPRANEHATREVAKAAAAPVSAPSRSPNPAALKTFGAPLGAGPVLSLADVLAAPQRFQDQPVTVEGHVRAACTRRGCWMELAAGTDPALPGCRVTFKDYGFFVPTDAAGSQAKVQGTFALGTLPAERVAHLESEGGQFPHKNADGSVNELKLVASGVELWR